MGWAMDLRKDADIIIKEALRRVMPDEAVEQALRGKAGVPLLRTVPGECPAALAGYLADLSVL